ASKVKLLNAVSSQLLGDSVDISLREDHGEASQVNVVESRSVTDELRLLESQIKLKEAEAIARRVGIRQAKEAEAKAKEAEAKAKEAEAKAKEVGIRQAEAEAKAKESDSENLRLRIQLDREFSTIEEAAKHADGYVLRHGRTNKDVIPPQVQRTFNPSLHRARQGNTNNSNFVRDRRSWTRSPPNGASKFSTYPCSHCGKPGHKAEDCWTRLQLNTGKPAMIVTEETNTSPVEVMADLSKADSMPIGLVFTKGVVRESAVSVLASRDFDLFQESFAKDPDVGTFSPFLSQGTVEVDGVETPVTILRDSGCLQTLIKEGVVAVRKADKTSFWAPFGVKVQLLWFFRVDLILGNDLLQLLEDDMPDNSLSLEGRFANPIASQDISSAVNAVTGRVALIAAQEQEVSLRLLFDLVSDPASDSGPTTRYLNQDGVLCRRWLPPT
ncbi:hypothetical protein Hamer_G031326, partial [Homarus americanus]